MRARVRARVRVRIRIRVKIRVRARVRHLRPLHVEQALLCVEVHLVAVPAGAKGSALYALY